MKKTNFILLIITTAIVWFISGCSSDDDPVSADITGTWYGTRSYYNPVGGTKFQYLSITLNTDHSGSMEYEAPTSYSAAEFTYTVSGSTIRCKGAYANTDGDVSDDFTMTLKIDGNRLIPQDKYSVFILTKDNSVMTDGNGNETISDDEKRDLLQNVWVNTDGDMVVVFYPNKSYEEYGLPYPGSTQYSSKTTGTYSYSYDLLDIYPALIGAELTQYTVKDLTETNLKITSSDRTLTFRRGSNADIPRDPALKEYLCSCKMGWGGTKNNREYIFNFLSEGKIYYLETSPQSHGSYGHYILRSSGTFSVAGSKVTCYFSDVTWTFGHYGDESSDFPGWKYGVPVTKTFNIEVTASGSLEVTLPNSDIIYLDKY